jgi:predicted dehydrogenase
MIRVGLVGAGPWAGMFTAPMLARAPDLSLAAVWARRPEAAADFARQHGTIAVDTFETLLDECDAVAFNVPADVQASLAVAAAEAGKHLLLEKPVAFTVADAEAVATAADAAGVATHLMLTYRFTDHVKAFLKEASRGKVEYFRSAFIGGGALDGPFATPWRRALRAALLDLGPHTLDLAELAAGPIREVRAAEAGGVVSVSSIHESGAVGHIAMSGTTPGVRGRLEADAVTDSGRTSLADPSPHEPGELLLTIAESFVRAVRGEISEGPDVHRGVHLQRLIAAVEKSIDSGRMVTL